MRRAFGFTLIEVVVVIGVMGIIASLMLANFPKFNRQIAVDREGGKLSLSLRKSQSYALAVREFSSTFNDDPYCTNPPVKFPGYGLFFRTSDKTSYLIFGDFNCSKYYDETTAWGGEAVEAVNIENRVMISQIKGYDAALCSAGCPLPELAILYIRPGPTTLIKSGVFDYNYAEIYLASQDGSVTKKVVVRSTGQISIE